MASSVSVQEFKGGLAVLLNGEVITRFGNGEHELAAEYAARLEAPLSGSTAKRPRVKEA